MQDFQVIVWNFQGTIQDLQSTEWDNTQVLMNRIQDLSDEIRNSFALLKAK